MEQSQAGDLKMRVEDARKKIQVTSDALRQAVNEFDSNEFQYAKREWRGEVTQATNDYIAACDYMNYVVEGASETLEDTIQNVVASLGDQFNPRKFEYAMYRVANDYADKIEPAFENFIGAEDMFEKAIHQAAQNYSDSGLADLKNSAGLALATGLGSAMLLGLFYLMGASAGSEESKGDPRRGSSGENAAIFAMTGTVGVGAGLVAWNTAKTVVRQVMTLLQEPRLEVNELMRDAQEE